MDLDLPNDKNASEIQSSTTLPRLYVNPPSPPPDHGKEGRGLFLLILFLSDSPNKLEGIVLLFIAHF